MAASFELAAIFCRTSTIGTRAVLFGLCPVHQYVQHPQGRPDRRKDLIRVDAPGLELTLVRAPGDRALG